MTPRENLISLWSRKGYEEAPVQFNLCPSLQEEFRRRYGEEKDVQDVFGFPFRGMPGPTLPPRDPEPDWEKYYDPPLRNVIGIDAHGIAREKGSEAAKHMSHMRHPMEHFDSVAQMEDYPWPDVQGSSTDSMAPAAEAIKAEGFGAMGNQACTVWEIAWYLRGMENLMMDMMSDDPMATYLLDRVTDDACFRAEAFARAGADFIHFGDDLGSQSTLLMSPEMYREWIKPRHTRVFQAVKKINPDCIVTYHSCGFVTPIIEDLMESGVEVLNPVQPECMDFGELHERFGDRLSFWGTVGTQTTIPHGTPEEVKQVVRKNLEIAGDKGGLLCTPTHLLEPEVPWENIEAYVAACREFSKAGR